jgi:hypothetical protein
MSHQDNDQNPITGDVSTVIGCTGEFRMNFEPVMEVVGGRFEFEKAESATL